MPHRCHSVMTWDVCLGFKKRYICVSILIFQKNGPFVKYYAVVKIDQRKYVFPNFTWHRWWHWGGFWGLFMTNSWCHTCATRWRHGVGFPEYKDLSLMSKYPKEKTSHGLLEEQCFVIKGATLYNESNNNSRKYIFLEFTWCHTGATQLKYLGHVTRMDSHHWNPKTALKGIVQVSDRKATKQTNNLTA